MAHDVIARFPAAALRTPIRFRTGGTRQSLESAAWLARVASVALLVSQAHARSTEDWSECLHAADPDERAEACTEIIGNVRDTRALVRALTGRGNALCATTERCPEAIRDFASVVKLMPNVAGYFDNYARALRAAGRYDEALRASQEAIDLAPQMPFAYSGKARTLEAAGRPSDALGVIETAMKLSSADAGLWEYRGKLLGELGRYGDANLAFWQSLKLQPDRVSVYVRRADVAMAQGRVDDAIIDLRRYPPRDADGDLVRGELNVLKIMHDRLATAPRAPTASEPTGRTETVADGASSAKPPCNLHDWTPVAQCIQDYHNENDPLPGGAPNPRRWNDALAAAGRALAEQHPEIQWDRAEWNAIVAQNAQDAASARAENEAHGEPGPETNEVAPDQKAEDAGGDANASERSNDASEIDKCDAPEVLSIIRKLSEEGVKKQAFRYLMANVVDVKFDLTGIRQLDYDATNERRTCAMDRKLLVTYYAETKRPPGRVSAPIQYEIERQLDGGHGSYVTCKCD